MQNEEYFEELNKLRTKEFYNHLYTFFKRRNISKWSERKIPMTKPKETIMKKHDDVYRCFIRDMHETIETTSKVVDKETGENPIYMIFAKYAESHRFCVPKCPTFEAEMKKYCTTKQHSVKSTRITTCLINRDKCNFIEKEKPDEIEPLNEKEKKFNRTGKNVDRIENDVDLSE